MLPDVFHMNPEADVRAVAKTLQEKFAMDPEKWKSLSGLVAILKPAEKK